MKHFHYSLLSAVLGIAIGVLLTVTVNKATANRARLRAEYQDWRKLNLMLQKVDEMYVDSVDKKVLTDAAITAALAKLDPHSVYMPPVELQESESELAGGFDGIGIQFNVPNDTAIVIEVIPGGPSEKIGLLPGDRLMMVDSVQIAGVKYPQDSMVRRMKGPAGTKVTVTVNRAGELIPFEITRGKIPTHCVDASFMVNDTTGYLRLSKFSRTTYAEVVEACARMMAEGMTKLIFDIRDNSGGYLEQAYALSNMFLPKDSMVVYMEGKHYPRQEYRADGRGFMQQIELDVLINEGSASSSEIFAGAIQDNHRGKIIGRRSYGKGLVQEPLFFTDGSGLRVTIARFYTPSGRCIQKPYSENYNYEVLTRYYNGEMSAADSMKIENGGILPDVFVPMDTTKASKFYIACNRKATAMRYASAYFDKHKNELLSIKDYQTLLDYLDGAGLEEGFLGYAKRVDGIVPAEGEWESSKEYMLTQVRALVGRYAPLSDNAFYHIYLDIDDVFKCAMAQ